MGLWISQQGWAPDCLVNGQVTEGESKPLFENTDDTGFIDGFDADNDDDGIPDSDDVLLDDKDPEGDPDRGIPDWHPKSKHKQ